MMEKEQEITNKVAASGLIQIDLENFAVPGKRVLFDLSAWLYEGLILKEKDYREKLKSHDWEQYRDCHVAITCTADAIVPTWAFMLAATYLRPVARTVVFGTLEKLEETLYDEAIRNLDPETYRDQRVIVKGCADVPPSAFVTITAMLVPMVKSIMYGEPCSTVPLFKKYLG